MIPFVSTKHATAAKTRATSDWANSLPTCHPESKRQHIHNKGYCTTEGMRQKAVRLERGPTRTVPGAHRQSAFAKLIVMAYVFTLQGLCVHITTLK